MVTTFQDSCGHSVGRIAFWTCSNHWADMVSKPFKKTLGEINQIDGYKRKNGNAKLFNQLWVISLAYRLQNFDGTRQKLHRRRHAAPHHYQKTDPNQNALEDRSKVGRTEAQIQIIHEQGMHGGMAPPNAHWSSPSGLCSLHCWCWAHKKLLGPINPEEIIQSVLGEGMIMVGKDWICKTIPLLMKTAHTKNFCHERSKHCFARAASKFWCQWSF